MGGCKPWAGLGVQFNARMVQEWTDLLGVDWLIRAHEACLEGGPPLSPIATAGRDQELRCQSGESQAVHYGTAASRTDLRSKQVFSASNYEGSGNQGAILVMQKNSTTNGLELDVNRFKIGQRAPDND